jgi:hypothetical protein
MGEKGKREKGEKEKIMWSYAAQSNLFHDRRGMACHALGFLLLSLFAFFPFSLFPLMESAMNLCDLK